MSDGGGSAAASTVDAVDGQFLHENRAEGCAPYALDSAARNGHLEIVKLLHENCGLSCSPKAMDDVARNGHLETLKFVHQVCSEGCTTRAMDGAALRGHTEVVKFLHVNRTEGCTVDALSFAASQGHFDIVEFLLENRSEGDVRVALIEAAFHGHLEVVRLLHENLRAGESTYFVVAAAVRKRNTAIIKFLCENQKHESTSILKKAVGNREEDVVRAVIPFSSLADLIDSKCYAFEQLQTEIGELLEKAIKGEPLPKKRACADRDHVHCNFTVTGCKIWQ